MTPMFPNTGLPVEDGGITPPPPAPKRRSIAAGNRRVLSALLKLRSILSLQDIRLDPPVARRINRLIDSAIEEMSRR